MEELRNEYKMLVIETQGKKPLGRLRDRWEEHFKI
jgi:hypothetical protein